MLSSPAGLLRGEMFRLIAGIAAAALLEFPVQAAERGPPAPTGAELAACRVAADQPICLLRLAARNSAHHPYAANIKIGYARDILAAIGPEPVNPNPAVASFIERLALPGRAAVQALVADRAGASPTDALAPIRAIGPSAPGEAASAASTQIEAYRKLWDAGHGDLALPVGRRPSERLIRAVLKAWTAELPLAGEHGDAEALVAALRAIGEVRAAERIPPPAALGFERVIFLVDAGRFDGAAQDVKALESSPTLEHRIDALMGRAVLMSKAVEAGRQDIALRFARSQLEAWFAEIADPSHVGSAHSGSDVPSSLVLLTQFAPRAEAVKWTERMEAEARRNPSLAAATSALAAAHAWTRLGEAGRAKAVLTLWPTPSEAELKACVAGLFKISAQCRASPGAALALMLTVAPLDASWEELIPMGGQMALAKRTAHRGLAGIDADLAKATTVEQRFRILQTCARAHVEEEDIQTIAACAHRLAVAPAPEMTGPRSPGTLSYDERRLDGALNAARQAAESGDLKSMGEMIDLSFTLAARTPDEPVNFISNLEDIAIAELRAQGRL